ncbi:MAG: ABC transporter permease [Elusimicrobiales bacterium]|nr:ABC transporter permease [Elusimicrobiales bacterium]
MNFISFIASRYIRGTGKNSAATFTTIISTIGVALSVTAIFVTLSIINGFQSEIRQKIMDFHPHITIYGEMNKETLEEIEKKLKEFKEIDSFSQFAIFNAILITPSRTAGCVIKAVKANEEIKITNISKSLKYGNWHNQGEAVIGEELAKLLGVYVGDEIIALIPKEDYLASITVPKMKKLKISGIINTGYFEYDSSAVFIDFSETKTFLSNQKIANGIEIRLKNPEISEKIKVELKKKIPFYFAIKTFSDINKNLFAALKIEKFIMSLVLSLIVLISTFAITSNLFIMTLIKKREIGIMRAIGISSLYIKKIFLTLATIISIIGTILGFIFSLIILFIVKKYKIVELPADIYYITKVPVKIEFYDIIFIIILTISLTIISAYYPAKKASEIDPVDAIRYG